MAPTLPSVPQIKILMTDLNGKTILIMMSKNQFDETELFGVRDGLSRPGGRVVILSPSGQEATSTQRGKFVPDGVLVDWNKQEGITGKYSAVIVVGGKGAPKSLWKDPILPQILTDHFRAGSVVGGIGLGCASLALAGILPGECAGPDEPGFLQVLEGAGLTRAPEPVTRYANVVTSQGADAVENFVATVIQAMTDS